MNVSPYKEFQEFQDTKGSKNNHQRSTYRLKKKKEKNVYICALHRKISVGLLG